MRRHYLPDGSDSPEDLAAALWLDNRYWLNLSVAVNNGIVQALRS